MSERRPEWFYRRDPWYWATWEGSRLAGLLAARDLSFWERLGQVEQLVRRAEEISSAEPTGPPASCRETRSGADSTPG